MNDLQRQNQATPQNAIAAIQKARTGRKLKDGWAIEEADRIFKIALALIGHKNFENEVLMIQIESLHRMLPANYPLLTIQELQYLTERGATGQYGEVMGINPKTFIGWIESYLKSNERKKAKRIESEQKRLEGHHKTLSDADRVELWEAQKKRLEAGKSILGELILFDIGQKFGKIDLSPEKVAQIQSKAIEWFKSERLRIVQQSGLTEAVLLHRIKEIIEADKNERSKMAFWQNRCKRVAVEMAMQHEISKKK